MNRWPFFLAILIFLSSFTQAQDLNEKQLIADTANSTSDTISPISPTAPTRGAGNLGSRETVTLNVKAKKKESEEDRLFDFDKRPYLLLLPSLRLNGAGFAPLSVAIGGGFSFEPRHMIFQGLAGYNTAHKSNDGTENNTKGHIRSLNAGLFYRFPRYWFVGTDASWGQLSTTNYKKQSWSMAFGGGRDFAFDGITTRLKLTYAPPTFDHVNGSQGINLEFYLPSPLEQRRFTYYELVGIMILHDTITDPHDPALTAIQKGNIAHTASCIFGVRVRL